jgi:hypothetical protein
MAYLGVIFGGFTTPFWYWIVLEYLIPWDAGTPGDIPPSFSVIDRPWSFGIRRLVVVCGKARAPQVLPRFTWLELCGVCSSHLYRPKCCRKWIWTRRRLDIICIFLSFYIREQELRRALETILWDTLYSSLRGTMGPLSTPFRTYWVGSYVFARLQVPAVRHG